MTLHRKDASQAGGIAVVIPLYNKAPWVAETIQSVLVQSRKPDEIIVVDDGSTDEGPAIVSKIGGSRVRLLRTEMPQSGPSAARNRGIQAAKSEWIALLDADDLWDPEYLFNVAQSIKRQPDVGCIFASRTMVGSARAFQHPPARNGDPARKLNLETYLDLWIETGQAGLSPMCSSSAVIRSDVIREAGLFPERYRRGEDKDTWLRVIAIADAIHLPQPLISYRRDLPGQLNQGPALELPPVIATAIELAQSKELSAGTRSKLRRLASIEAWLYAKRRRLRPFDKRALEAMSNNPLRYCLLAGLYGAGALRERFGKLMFGTL